MEFADSTSPSRPVLQTFAGRVARIAEWLTRNRFSLAAFLIPVGIRAIPELIVGPYPVGWDTIASYVPNTLDWAGGRVGLLQMLESAPLMYLISVPIYDITRVNPVWIFKMMGPLLYGCMIFALFRFLRKSLGWSEQFALGGALLTSMYFITLRISWDLYRSMIGLTFILLIITLLHDSDKLGKQAITASLLVLAIASDQLTGVIALFLVAVRTLTKVPSKTGRKRSALVISALPGTILLLLMVYGDFNASVGSLAGNLHLTPTAESLTSSFGFLAYSYLPLSPFILLGLASISNKELRSWSGLCAVTTILASTPLFGLVVASYRWTLLLDIPLCIYAIAGLAIVVRSITGTARKLAVISDKAIPVISLVLAVSASLYVALPAQQAVTYFSVFPELLPTSMVQNTVPFSDMASLNQTLAWVASNIDLKTALITHQAIYGWVAAYFPQLMVRVVGYGYSSPLEGWKMARSLGYSSILLVWWVNGSGWHNQPTVPHKFVPVHSEGTLVVYSYQDV